MFQTVNQVSMQTVMNILNIDINVFQIPLEGKFKTEWYRRFNFNEYNYYLKTLLRLFKVKLLQKYLSKQTIINLVFIRIKRQIPR